MRKMKLRERKRSKPTNKIDAFKPLSKFDNNESHQSWCPLGKRIEQKQARMASNMGARHTMKMGGHCGVTARNLKESKLQRFFIMASFTHDSSTLCQGVLHLCVGSWWDAVIQVRQPSQLSTIKVPRERRYTALQFLQLQATSSPGQSLKIT